MRLAWENVKAPNPLKEENNSPDAHDLGQTCLTEPQMQAKTFKIAALSIITAMAALLLTSHAFAGSLDKGSSYTETREMVYDAGGDVGDLKAKGGAVGVYVADGVAIEGEGMSYKIRSESEKRDEAAKEALGAAIAARWHFIQGEKGSMHVGLGAGGFVADKPLKSEAAAQSLSQQAEMGLSVSLKDNVSLKAGGRYQRIGDALGPDVEAMGGNFGVKVTF